MKLGELLNKKYLNEQDEKRYKPDTIVAIGAKTGGSYMYIGRADGLGMIDKLFERYRKQMERKLVVCKTELRMVMSELSKLTIDDETEFGEVVLAAEKVRAVYNRYLNIKDYLNTYVPVMERNVCDQFDKDFGNEKAIIVIGKEVGSFWFKSEFDKKYGTK